MADYIPIVRKMPDHELYGFIANFQQNWEGYIAGTQELRRRNEAPNSRRAWTAIAISLVALTVSIIALIRKW